MAETWLTRRLAWLVEVAQQHKVKLGVYLLLITAFWTALVAFPKALDPLLPPFPKDREYLRNWLGIGIGLGVPTAILLLTEGTFALVQWWRDRRLSRWALGTPVRGHFQLTPYERGDQDRFRRADGAQDDILAWLRAAEPMILYLSGRSGSGKSSLLNASVLPGLEAGNPRFLTLTIRSFGDPIADLAAELTDAVYTLPPKDLPNVILPLLRRVNDRLGKQDQRLLVVIDQFEEFLIFHDREPEQQQPFRRLLADLHCEPLGCIRLLLVLRADYLEDVARLDLPRLHEDHNWKQVGPFTAAEARDFLRGGFEELGSELIAAVVRHASELDETRGKVRPVVLNMIGLALGSHGGQASRVLGPREAQRLMFDHVREGLKDPLARDHAPRVLARMITPEGRKELPASAAELAERAGLSVPLIQGCLNRLDLLGFVRSFDSDREHSAGTQVWEVSHDFVARLLSLILPSWKASPWSRLRRALGPTLMAMGIAAIFGLPLIRERWRMQAIEHLQTWAGRYGATTRHNEDGTFGVIFGRESIKPPDFPNAIRADCSDFAHLIRYLDLRSNNLASLPPEVTRLTRLTSLNLSNNRMQGLPPEVPRLTRLTALDLSGNSLESLPPEIGGLTRLTLLYLRGNRLTRLPAEIVGLARLTNLDLDGNGMKSLPPEVTRLTHLTTLDLSYNELKSLPPEFGELTSLTELDLSSNKRIVLPAEIVRLARLTTLNLNFDALGNLPPEVCQLKHLTRLDLSGGRVTSLPPEFAMLTNLTRLDLSSNLLHSLPNEVIQLPNLTRLDLSGNSLESLPPEVGRLTNLTELILNNNRLISLPPEIGRLTRLTTLGLYGNDSLIDPPPEVVVRETGAVLEYLRGKLSKGKP